MNRLEAKEQGLKTYEGVPCNKFGHTLRQAGSGACIECVRLWKIENKERLNAQHRAWNNTWHERHTPEEFITKAYKQQRAQARFRKEGWDFNDEAEWHAMWDDKFELRGKKKGEYTMTRVNDSLPWSKANCNVHVRADQLRLTNKARATFEFKTPTGVHHSLKDAAIAHNLTIYHMQQLQKKSPREYYYLKDA